MTDDVRELRAAALRAQPGLIPCGPGRSQSFAGQLRAKKVERDGQLYYQLDGYASVTERGYEMWDMFGPYTEIVSAGAFEKTLAANPDVAFLVNHRGVTMARTVNGSLVLSEDETGLHSLAWLNPKRQDVQDLVIAVEDSNVTEMSFAFTITSGRWSPDYMEYRIDEADLDRGDVSAVNYGANPHTSIAARSKEILDALDLLPAGAARAAMSRLERRRDIGLGPAGGGGMRAIEAAKEANKLPAAEEQPATEQRTDTEPQKTGRSTALIRTMLLTDEDQL